MFRVFNFLAGISITMKSGTVKMWDVSKGFGFITSDDDDDFFVHSSDLHISVNNQRLIEGQTVKFDIKRDMKGDRAINVKVIK
jgi:CspA family cold shock protein